MKFKKLYATVGMAASVLALSHSAHAATTYTVKPGDSLYKIGQAQHVSIASLKTTNHLTSNMIYPGEALKFPATQVSSKSATYIVKSGDSLYKISRAHHVSVSELKALNGLSGTTIYPGQTLNLPVGTSSTTSSTSTQSLPSSSYIVKSGDSLYKIGRDYGVSVQALKDANHLSSDVINVGQTLNIPGKSDATSSSQSHLTQRFTNAQKQLLDRLVTAEAQGQPFAAQVEVTNVILNRIESSQFPNTLDGVIYQTYGSHYAFTPVENGTINQPATAQATKAVNEALTQHQPYQTGDALFYYNPAKVSNSWILSRPVTARIGNTTFAS